MFSLCTHCYLNIECEISGSWLVIFLCILFFGSAYPQNNKLPKSAEHSSILPLVPALQPPIRHLVNVP